jgi:hypothetical protein
LRLAPRRRHLPQTKTRPAKPGIARLSPAIVALYLPRTILRDENAMSADGSDSTETDDNDDASTDRLVTLSDGVVAIALTLLILSIQVPSPDGLRDPRHPGRAGKPRRGQALLGRPRPRAPDRHANHQVPRRPARRLRDTAYTSAPLRPLPS